MKDLIRRITVSVAVVCAFILVSGALPENWREYRFRYSSPEDDRRSRPDTVIVERDDTAASRVASSLRRSRANQDSTDSLQLALNIEADSLSEWENRHYGASRPGIITNHTFDIINTCAHRVHNFSVAYIDSLNRLVTRGWFGLKLNEHVAIEGVYGNGLFLSDSVMPEGGGHSEIEEQYSQSNAQIFLPIARKQFVFRTLPLRERYRQDQASKVDMRTTVPEAVESFTYRIGNGVDLLCDLQAREKFFRPDTANTFYYRYTR